MSIDSRPVTQITRDAVDITISKILSFLEVSRKHGLLAMIPMLDKKALEDRSNLFEYGIAMVCNGTDAAIIEDILQNIQKLKEPSYTQKAIDTLLIIGVLGIQEGANPHILLQRLDSRIPESCRSDSLKSALTKINLDLVNENKFPRIYLHPEETTNDFEKLATLSNEQIQEIMRGVDSDTLAAAICGNDIMKGVFYPNMSQKAAEMLDAKVRSQDTKIIDAQQEIIVIAEKLKFI